MGANQVVTRAGALEAQHGRGVRVFRGIPYARPPVAELRFRAPEPVPPWRGARPARSVVPAAPQALPDSPLLRTLTAPFGVRQSEDCLYLNVWTPEADRRRRPVLVWIHGGAFVLGSGTTRFYDGTRLARRGDVVVVTLNYRLGALGFLQLPEARGGGISNLGLRDQIAALEWVRDNIESFGGDPENVTLFGESAGAMSIGSLLGAPRARGLFRRAILQSGAAHNVSSAAQGAQIAEHFLSALGVGPELEALQRVSVVEILRAQRAALARAFTPGGPLPWQPALDADLLPEPPLDALSRGAAKSVELLIGTNRDEWKLFMFGDRKGHRLDEPGLARRFERVLATLGASDGAQLERALQCYRASALAPEPHAPRERWVAFQTDRVFRYPALALADRQAQYARSFAYLFTWSPPLLGSRIGSCHALEIPFVFGTLRDPWLLPLLGPTARRALRVSRQIQDAWIAFARSGDPSHADLRDWPAYTAGERLVMRIGARPTADAASFEQARGYWGELI